jgi:hypothetical protein
VGFWPEARDEYRQLDKDPSRSSGASLCLAAIAAVARRDYTRRDLQARSIHAFPAGIPFVEICGGVAIAYCADFDSNGHVQEVVILHAGMAAPTGVPPLTWSWRQTAVERYHAYSKR